MRNLHLFLCLCLVVATLASCTRGPKLVGTWRAAAGREVLTFAPDGGLIVQSDKGTIQGRYVLLEGNRVMLEIGSDAHVGQIFTYEFAGPDLLLTEPGKTTPQRYVRAEPAAAPAAATRAGPPPASLRRGEVQTLKQDPQQAIRQNLLMLSAAADLFYLEHGVSTASYDQLVGPDKSVKAIRSIEGEDYRQLRFEQGQPFVITTPTGRTVRVEN
jgi:hypothetical protein